MTSKIQILDEATINQIAAGEVIENPASVVKELVENAIDAKASEIKVVTKAGGRQLICVTDNGCGMNEEEIELSVERHATSKIKRSSDLYKLSTLGFRGEALATVSAVSKLMIASATADDPGAALFIEGGKKIKKTPFARQRGTTVEVASLFYNVPARRKFQKSIGHDTTEMGRMLIDLALSHPFLSFEWIHDDKVQFSLSSKQTLPSRIETLLGLGYCNEMISIEHTEGEYALHGFISLPCASLPSRKGQYLFVNDRAITSAFLSDVIQEAFGERISSSRFPHFILYLKAPASTIDVNIHPRKKEIRFQETEHVKNLGLNGVRGALESHFAPVIRSRIDFVPAPLSAPVMPNRVAEVPIERKAALETEESKLPVHILFSLGDYLFVRGENEVIVVDQKRARQRIFFEKLNHSKPAIQHLLFPLNIEMNLSDYEVVMTKLPLIRELGIGIRPFGGTTFVIESLPEIFDENEIESLLHFLVEEAKEERKDELMKKLTEIFCSKVRKKEFSTDESQEIVEALFRCTDPRFSPLGKPTYFKITEKEIAKWLT
jgi:DNA mismatch repair protein MutL